jgi:hypothetical protein
VAGMEFRIAFERLTIDEKAVEDAIEGTMGRDAADGRADLVGRRAMKETWEQRELRHGEETKLQLLEALRVCDWNQAAAARELGRSRQAFWKQLKRNLASHHIAHLSSLSSPIVNSSLKSIGVASSVKS